VQNEDRRSRIGLARTALLHPPSSIVISSFPRIRGGSELSPACRRGTPNRDRRDIARMIRRRRLRRMPAVRRRPCTRPLRPV
jgi:hypothetical protein